MIEVQKLMIGDWVLIESCRGFEQQAVRVETIPDEDSDYAMGHHNGHIGCYPLSEDNDFRDDIESVHLFAIPLTEEIMRLQNFDPDIIAWWPDGQQFHVDIDGVTINAEGLVSCVHELQQLLRVTLHKEDFKLPDSIKHRV